MTYQNEVLPFQRGFYRETQELPRGSGNLVRLQDDVRDGVAYLGISDPSNPDAFNPVGTGFFIVWDNSIYLVTADHVAKGLEDGGFCVRMNQKSNGLARNHLVEYAHWYRHPTTPKTVDIAIMEFAIPDWSRAHVIPSNAFLTEFKLGSKKIGPGDIAYVVGVFSMLRGKRRNIPAVHTGHVCLIPEDEAIPVEDWNAPNPENAPPVEVEAYLVQVPNTLPGCSGSPVFVRRSIETRLFDENVDPNPKGIQQWVHGSLWLLGVWSDAWFVDPAGVLGIAHGKIVPWGIGVTVPTTKLVDILNHPEIVKKRRERTMKELRTVMPSKTAIKTVTRSGDDILRAALNTPPIEQKKPKAKVTKRGRAEVNSK